MMASEYDIRRNKSKHVIERVVSAMNAINVLNVFLVATLKVFFGCYTVISAVSSR